MLYCHIAILLEVQYEEFTMKEFNKWWEKRRRKIYHGDITSAVEETWKAALEWVKSRSDHSKELYMINDYELERELEE